MNLLSGYTVLATEADWKNISKAKKIKIYTTVGEEKPALKRYPIPNVENSAFAKKEYFRIV